MARISWRVIARPSPVPPNLRVVEASACSNFWKRRESCSGVMPSPESVTEKVSASSSMASATVTAPCSVNFTALDNRFAIT